MGWVWKDDEELNSSSSNEIDKFKNPNYSTSDTDGCSTRKIMKSQCKTEEVEPGKFIRKCEKTEEILRDCIGKGVEVIKSNKEYTEDDVTDMVVKGYSGSGKFDESPFGFPGLRNDIDGIEHHFLGGIGRFFEAAEQMRGSIFDTFGEFYKDNPSSYPSMRRGIPIEEYSQKEASPKQKETESGSYNLSSLAKDV